MDAPPSRDTRYNLSKNDATTTLSGCFLFLDIDSSGRKQLARFFPGCFRRSLLIAVLVLAGMLNTQQQFGPLSWCSFSSCWHASIIGQWQWPKMESNIA